MTSNCVGKTKRMMLLYKWWMCSFKGHLRTLHLNWFYLKMNKNVDYQVCTLPSVFSIQMVTDRHHCANIHIRITYSTLLLPSHLATWHYSSADITTNMRMLNPTIRVFIQRETAQTALLDDLQIDTHRAKQKTLSTPSSPLSHDITLSKRTFAPLMCLWGTSRWPLICSYNNRLLENLLWPETHKRPAFTSHYRCAEVMC